VRDAALKGGAPRGLVAFLFTDIEGSTTRWEAHREAMQEALRRHDDLMRAAIESRGGYVFKTIGDAFCAAFASTDDALLAAIEAQRRIGAEDWSAVNGLRVRMAIHAGETDERSGDYFGPAVNRVARLLAVGHGGQVLLSGFATELAAPHLPPGVALRHLGTLPLKDLKEPERVHQLTVPDLQSDFKALRALETPPNNLPRQPTSFVGRDEELSRVQELVRSNVLVTIVGAGGMGKTRFALRIATNLLNETSGGAWFVDLAPVSDASLVASTILSALGADQTGSTPPLDRLIAYLKKRALLLLIDNCEHLLDEVARVVTTILAQCPEVVILATSRERLNVAGEYLHHLASLEPSSAVRLFEERARAANPRFALNDANRDLIADICRRLDGIALGIELAAARVRSISIEDLAKRLEFRMLSGGGRERLARQQTMRALVDWSYDLLTADEKTLFRRLAVFAGGFTLDAAMAACADESIDELSVLDLLESLADKSLLVVDSEEKGQRYRFLAPIKDYAREQLDANRESDEALRRHALTFAAAAERAYEEWDTAPGPDWLMRQERELDNYRCALRWSVDEHRDPQAGVRIAGSAAPAFMRLSLLPEAIAWCERAMEAAATMPPATEARLLYVLSMLYNNRGLFDRSLTAAERAAENYRKTSDQHGLALALSQVAQQSAKVRSLEAAQAVASEAVTLARRLGDRRLLALTLTRCATVFGSDRIEEARAAHAESLAILRELGRDDETTRALVWWMNTEALAGQTRAAAAIAEEALQLADLADGELRMSLSISAADLYLELGERERAIPLARTALARSVKADHPVATSFAIAYLAHAASRTDPVEAARMLGYVRERQRMFGWIADDHERELLDGLQRTLDAQIAADRLTELFAEGASWSEENAVARAARI